MGKKGKRKFPKGAGQSPMMSQAAQEEQEAKQERWLEDLGLERKYIPKDGGCMFRALSECIHKTQTYHLLMRMRCVEFLRSHADDYSPFVEEPFDHYLHDMSRPDSWGGELELQVISVLYNVTIFVYDLNLCEKVVIGNGTSNVCRVGFSRKHYDCLYEIGWLHKATMCQQLVYAAINNALGGGESVRCPKTYKNIGITVWKKNLDSQKKRDRRLAQSLEKEDYKNLSGYYEKSPTPGQLPRDTPSASRAAKGARQAAKAPVRIALTPSDELQSIAEAIPRDIWDEAPRADAESSFPALSVAPAGQPSPWGKAPEKSWSDIVKAPVAEAEETEEQRLLREKEEAIRRHEAKAEEQRRLLELQEQEAVLNALRVSGSEESWPSLGLGTSTPAPSTAPAGPKPGASVAPVVASPASASTATVWGARQDLPQQQQHQHQQQPPPHGEAASTPSAVATSATSVWGGRPAVQQLQQDEHQHQQRLGLGASVSPVAAPAQATAAWSARPPMPQQQQQSQEGAHPPSAWVARPPMNQQQQQSGHNDNGAAPVWAARAAATTPLQQQQQQLQQQQLQLQLQRYGPDGGVVGTQSSGVWGERAAAGRGLQRNLEAEQAEERRRTERKKLQEYRKVHLQAGALPFSSPSSLSPHSYSGSTGALAVAKANGEREREVKFGCATPPVLREGEDPSKKWGATTAAAVLASRSARKPLSFGRYISPANSGPPLDISGAVFLYAGDVEGSMATSRLKAIASANRRDPRAYGVASQPSALSQAQRQAREFVPSYPHSLEQRHMPQGGGGGAGGQQLHAMRQGPGQPLASSSSGHMGRPMQHAMQEQGMYDSPHRYPQQLPQQAQQQHLPHQHQQHPRQPHQQQQMMQQQHQQQMMQQQQMQQQQMQQQMQQRQMQQQQMQQQLIQQQQMQLQQQMDQMQMGAESGRGAGAYQQGGLYQGGYSDVYDAQAQQPLLPGIHVGQEQVPMQYEYGQGLDQVPAQHPYPPQYAQYPPPPPQQQQQQQQHSPQAFYPQAAPYHGQQPAHASAAMYSTPPYN